MKANTASRTAQYMALFRAFETARNHRSRLFSDPYARCFLDWKFQILVSLAASPFVARIILKAFQMSAPGALSSGIARTRLIDDLLQDTVLAGSKQVMILGAGFDTRGLRLEYLNRVPVMEIDHHDTQSYKLKRLKECRKQLPDHRISYYQIDFNEQSLEDLAARCDFGFGVPTTVIWEGVTNYLTALAVDRAFDFMKKFETGSSVIFTYIEKRVLYDPGYFTGAKEVMRNLEKFKEQWTFGFDPDALPQYLSGFGLMLLKDYGASQYRSKYGLSGRSFSPGYEFYRVALANRI